MRSFNIWRLFVKPRQISSHEIYVNSFQDCNTVLTWWLLHSQWCIRHKKCNMPHQICTRFCYACILLLHYQFLMYSSDLCIYIFQGCFTDRETITRETRVIFIRIYICKRANFNWTVPRPLFTKRTDVLLQDLAKPRRPEIRVSSFPFAMKFDRHLGSSAAEMPVKI